MKSKLFVGIIVGVVVGCFITYLLEGRYYYEKEGSQIVRINKFSGDPARLTDFGWEEIKEPVRASSFVTPSTNHIWDVILPAIPQSSKDGQLVRRPSRASDR
jgi:hypothetical protein